MFFVLKFKSIYIAFTTTESKTSSVVFLAELPKPNTHDWGTKIEKKMHELSSKDERIVREVLPKEEALKRFENNPYKIELIKDIDEDMRRLRRKRYHAWFF